MRTVWRPQPKQAAFMERPEYEVLYGGAAGGGKSDALLCEGLRQVQIPHYRGLILRKTYPQLSELIDRSRELYQAAFPRARYNGTEHFWAFPSGAKIYFGAMQHSKDRINYQGKRYDYIAFDELTHFSWEEYSYLFSRNRPSGPGTRVYMRASTNPGGPGHGWVKDRFISVAPPMTRVVEEMELPGPDGKPRKMQRDRMFVPATVYDNQALLRNAPGYLASLGMLPEAEKRALLMGDWDSFSGQVFTEWRNDPAHYDDQRWTHVVKPFRIPDWWRIYRGFDWGYAKPFSVGWYAVNDSGRIYRIREYYGISSGGEPNTGAKMEPREVAREIRRIEREDENLRGRTIFGIADPAIFQENGGESVGDAMGQEGVYWDKGDHTRIAGKMQCHYRLAFDPEGLPMFQVFSTCRHFIRTVPTLVYDMRDVEDVESKLSEDHIYDEWRYVMMANPIRAVRPHTPPPELLDDPLELRGKPRPSYYRIR